jgi:hypothetical protein
LEIVVSPGYVFVWQSVLAMRGSFSGLSAAF